MLFYYELIGVGKGGVENVVVIRLMVLIYLFILRKFL